MLRKYLTRRPCTKTPASPQVENPHQRSGHAVRDSYFSVPLVKRTAKHFDITDAADDKAYPIHRNTETVEGFGRTPHIPFKTDTVPPKDDLIWAKMYYIFMCYRQLFSQRYHKRSNVGSVFSMLKGRFKDFARFKSDDGGQVNEAIA